MNGAGYGIAYLILYGAFALSVLAALLFAAILYGRGYRRSAGLVLLVMFCAGVIPAALSHRAGGLIGQAAENASFAPEAFDFAGKRVIFAETGSTICGEDVCGYALRHGGLAQVYSIAANNLSYHYPDLSWPFDAMMAEARVYRIGLTDPEKTHGGLALPDPVEELKEIPPVDYTILADDSFVALEYASAFGLPEDVARSVRFAYMVFEGWPKPDQAPVARLLTAQYSTMPYFIWPVSSEHRYDPPLFEHRDHVRSWFCAAPVQNEYFGPEACDSD